MNFQRSLLHALFDLLDDHWRVLALALAIILLLTVTPT